MAPEPATIIVGGLVLYGMFKGRGTTPTRAQLAASPAQATAGAVPIDAGALAGTTPDSPLATTATDQGITLADAGLMTAVQEPVPVLTIPSDLVAALDNQTALAMRAYAAMYPDDFHAFLDRYADRVVLRNDLMFEKLTSPPDAGPIEVTPGMLAGMGNAAYKVVQALNGVYVGKSVDVFGVSASVAGAIPGMNQDFISSLQAAAMGYRAITSISQVMSIAAANQVGVTTLMSWSPSALGAVGAYPGLAALPLTGVLMAAGLVIDIGFTILSDKPDLQKAIDVALDVASLAVLFIPVIGVIIAIIIQLVKFIIDLFGDDLFGGGMSHEQREILETARYGENISPMYPQLVDAITPRELFKVIVGWGSGYCGGYHIVAMAVSLVLKAGDQLMVGGQPFIVSQDMTLGFGDNEQPGGCYWLKSGPFANITNDEQAWALGVYGPVNGVIAGAQAGIAEWRQVQFEDPVVKIIMARTQPMRDFLVKHKLSLDQIDMIALEYRAQPHLNALAASYGFETWQELFAAVVNEEWESFNDRVTHGSLTDFARENGYPTMYAYRAAALQSYESYFTRVEQASATLYQNGLDAQRALLESQMLAAQQGSAP